MDTPGVPAGSGRNLPLAITSGLLLAALFFGTLAWNPWAFLTFVATLVVIGLLELDSAFRTGGVRPFTVVAVAAGLVMLYGSYGAGPSGQVVGLVLLLIGSGAWLGIERHAGTAVAGLEATLLMAVWVPFLASFLGLLLARPGGTWLVMATVALTVSNDIGAYAFGSAFGRRKLAPKVSPAKSWEGFAGGLLTVLVLAGAVTPRVVEGLSTAGALVLGTVIAVAATYGDLAESLVKRDLGLKDLGRILPGHGGIMDRVDAMLFTLPVAHVALLALGV